MNAVLEQVNSTGKAFVEFAVPMLVQSGVLIVILLLIDLALRKKVKAVFRYCIWMLILLKLILPTSLSSPLSLGYWFGDKLAYVAESRTAAAPEPEAEEPALANMLHIIEPVPIERERPAPAVLPMIPDVEPAVTEAVGPPAAPVTPVTWQGVVFLLWLAVVIALGLLLLQRAMFVRGLVAQAKEANALMNDALEYCCKCMGVKRKVGLKVSANAASPAVCGLFRPVILLPHKLAPSLGSRGLRAVLLHELAHIRRGDLWVNLAQTVLQIMYFYNPLLWLANAMIRRVREQAIDETVLVRLRRMGEKAQQYPQTLVNVAKLAFKRPVLSLRLIGVVESKSALAGRIKHILNRPMPKSAKIGIVGVLAVIIAGAVLLPMAKAKENQKALRGIDEKLNVSDKAGELTINSLYMTSPDGKSLLGNNSVTLSVGVTNNSQKEIYLGFEYYTDSGTVAKVFSPGASSLAQIRRVASNWQGRIEFPIRYNRFVKGGYVKITLAKCSGNQLKEATLAFLPVDSEVLHEKKYVIFPCEKEKASKEPTFKKSLPNGVTVELVGVCEHPSEGKQWWRPDGSLLEEAPYDDDFGRAFPQDGEKGYKFAVKYSGLAGKEVDARVIPTDFKTTNGGALFSTSEKNGKENTKYVEGLLDEKIVWLGAAFDEKLGHCDIRIGVCRGDWKSDYRYKTDQPNDIVEWVEFKNVSLKPNFKTDVQVEVEKAAEHSKAEVGHHMTFTMPIYDRNASNFGQYIGGNLSRFDTDYIKLERYGLTVGASPEELFEKQGKCAFYMKKDHEFVGVRGTMVAPISVPNPEPEKKPTLVDRLELMSKEQIIKQIKDYLANNRSNISIKLKEGMICGVITPEKRLVVMKVYKFGTYESGAEATTLTFLDLGKVKDDKETDVEVEGKTDSLGQLGDAPEEVRAIGKVLSGWFDTCVAGDLEKVKKAYLPSKSNNAKHDLQRMKQLLEVDSNWQFSLLAVIWDAHKATAVSHKISHPGADSPLVFVWQLKKFEGQWRIADQFGGGQLNEFPSLDEFQRYLYTYIFLQEYPTGQMWLDTADPNLRLRTNSRKSEAASFEKSHWPQLDGAPEQVQQIAKVLKRWFAACLAEDAEQVKELYRPNTQRHAEDKLKEMNRILAMAPGWWFSPMMIKFSKSEADAISHPMEKINFPGATDPMISIVRFRKVEGQWTILSSSMDGLRSLPDSYAYFYRRYPDGRIWFDKSIPDWLKPEQQTGVDVDIEELKGISEKVKPGYSLAEKVRAITGDKEIFESYFTDSNEGGKALDQWWPVRDKDPDIDKKIFSMVRNGLRRDSQGKERKYRNKYIKWVGNKYIWRAKSQNQDAIELMYYATFDSQLASDAVYYGLSVVRGKRSDKILKRLVELCMANVSVSRILWGTKGWHEDMLRSLEPYLKSGDLQIRDRASVLEKVFKGEIDYGQWETEQRRQKLQAEFGEKLPEIRKVLLRGNSHQRREVFELIGRKGLKILFDESFAEPLKACLEDGDPQVREAAIQYGRDWLCKPGQQNPEVMKLMNNLSKDWDSKVREAAAVFIGSRWIWGAEPQNPKAIEIMMELSKDKDREVREAAVYYGLSVVENKSDKVIKRLIEMALDAGASSNLGRIGWGLGRGADKEKLKMHLMPYLELENRKGERARQLYREMFKAEPPNSPKEETKENGLVVKPSALQSLIDSARPGDTVIVPEGVYTEPIEITKSLTLKGKSRAGCVFEVTADKPAIFVDTKGKGRVTIEAVTIKWQLATSDKNIEHRFALGVKDSRVEVKDCYFQPLGNFKRCPVAIQAIGFSNLTINTCRFEGFEYTVCYGEGTEGTIQDSLVMGSGHQGISLYSGATVKIIRNVVTGSEYHGVRSTGGTLDMKDNLIIGNANRGVYLGNKSAHGTITNNIITGNRLVGISGFAQSDVKIYNNLILDSGRVGIGAQPSCRFLVKDNIIKGNPSGMVVFLKEGARWGNLLIRRNTFWNNDTDTENCEKAPGSISEEPVFRDPANGDFSLTGGKVMEQKQGLTDPKVFKALWKRWKNRAVQTDVQVEGEGKVRATVKGQVLGPNGKPVVNQEVHLQVFAGGDVDDGLQRQLIAENNIWEIGEVSRATADVLFKDFQEISKVAETDQSHSFQVRMVIEEPVEYPNAELLVYNSGQAPSHLLHIQKKVLFDESDFVKAELRQSGKQPQMIVLQLTKDAVKRLKVITSANIRRRMAIVLDSKILAIPIITELVSSERLALGVSSLDNAVAKSIVAWMEGLISEVKVSPQVTRHPDWSQADLALKGAMNRDPSYARTQKHMPQQLAIEAWEDFLKRDDLTEGQRIFALWRVASLYACNMDGSLGEKPNFRKSKRLFKQVRDYAPSLWSEEIANAITQYGSHPFSSDMEKASVLAENYRWVKTRTNETISNSAPRINRYGYLIDLKFFLRDGATLGDASVKDRMLWLQRRLKELEKAVERQITGFIKYCKDDTAALSLIALLQKVADVEDAEKWQNMIPTKRFDVQVEGEGESTTGWVVDGRGHGIAGVTMEFYQRDTKEKKSTRRQTIQTREDGSFVIPFIELGEHGSFTNITAPGFDTRMSVSFTRRKDGTFYPDDRRIKLYRLGSIAGRVYDTDGNPLVGAPLSLATNVQYPNHSSSTANHLRAITDENGRFVMMNVPPGVHLLYYPWSGPSRAEVEKGIWDAYIKTGERYPSAPIKGVLSAQVIEVREGEKIGEVVVDLSQSTCSVTGQVHDTHGRVVADAMVSLYWVRSGGWGSVNGKGYPPVATDAEGRYRLQNLPPGNWHIKTWHDQVKQQSKPVPIELKPGRTIQQDLALSGQPEIDAPRTDVQVGD